MLTRAGPVQFSTWKVTEPESWEGWGKSHVRLEQLLKEQEVVGSWVADSNDGHSWQLIPREEKKSVDDALP